VLDGKNQMLDKQQGMGGKSIFNLKFRCSSPRFHSACHKR